MFDLYVQDVDSASNAFKRGLRNEVQIIRIDGDLVHSTQELQSYFNGLAANKNKISVQLEVRREDKSLHHIYIPLDK